MIMSAEEPKYAFKYFLENADYINSSDEKDIEAYFTAQQMQKYSKEYGRLIDGLLNKLTNRHYEKEKFYFELWENINSDLLFDDKDVKIYALGRIWSDSRIPYFCVKDGIKMSNEEFAAILENKKKLLQEVTFILSCQYEQKTESSSLLLDVIKRCDNNKEKAVVLAKILNLTEKRTLLTIMNMNSKN